MAREEATCGCLRLMILHEVQPPCFYQDSSTLGANNSNSFRLVGHFRRNLSW